MQSPHAKQHRFECNTWLTSPDGLRGVTAIKHHHVKPALLLYKTKCARQTFSFHFIFYSADVVDKVMMIKK